MLRFIIYLFRLPKLDESELDRIKRRLVQKYSRGNVHLQMGKFLTEQDISSLKNDILKYSF